jgi:hypothetical protein
MTPWSERIAIALPLSLVLSSMLAQVRTAPVARILAGLESISYQNQRWSGLVPMFQQICQRREILDLQAALHFNIKNNIKNNDCIATDQ